jgi:hypothetical protein
MGIKNGDLIKWISHHNSFEASPDTVVGIDPVYRFGIVLEVSNVKTSAIVAHCFDCKNSRLVILDTDYDYVELVSENNNG